MPRGLRRFYIEAEFPAEEAVIKLSSRETFHLHRVLRLEPGDPCQIFNPYGWGAEAQVEIFSEKEGARLKLKKIFPLNRPSLRLKVGQALPQRKKMDDLIMRAEELGVHELWVLETDRTVVKMRGDGRERVRNRWERIVVEAAKQSGSPVLMRVEGPLPFKKILEEKVMIPEKAFIFHPDPEGLHFSEMIEGLREGKAPAEIFLFFGPEGGFTDEEVRLAESRGVKKVFLGDSILRLETAFLGVISAIRLMIAP